MREWLYVVMQQMVSHAPHPPTQSPGTGAWGQADGFGVFRGTGDAFWVFGETGLGCSGRGVWGVHGEGLAFSGKDVWSAQAEGFGVFIERVWGDQAEGFGVFLGESLSVQGEG